MDKVELVYLELPEGMTKPAVDAARKLLGEMSAAFSGYRFVLLANGIKRAPQRVEHHLAPALDEAVMALPRIADNLERLVELLKEEVSRADT